MAKVKRALEELAFAVGDTVAWEGMDYPSPPVPLIGTVSHVSDDDDIVRVYFPYLKAEETFYTDGRYTKFDTHPTLVKVDSLPAGAVIYSGGSL